MDRADGPTQPGTIQCMRTRGPAMDMGFVESQPELTAAPAAGPGTGSRTPGGGGGRKRKHLSSIANHVLRQCSLCVRPVGFLDLFIRLLYIIANATK